MKLIERNLLKLLTILVCILTYSYSAPAQCKKQKKPNKFLYRGAFGSKKKVKVAIPSSVEKATKITDLIPWFGFEHAAGSFCLAKNKDQNYLYFSAYVNYNKDWNVKKNDPMTVYFDNKDSIRLEPATDYDGKRKGLVPPSTSIICFYLLSKENLEDILKHNISKLSMQITSVPTRDETEKDIPENEAYVFGVSRVASRKLQAFAKCYLNDIK